MKASELVKLMQQNRLPVISSEEGAIGKPGRVQVTPAINVLLPIDIDELRLHINHGGGLGARRPRRKTFAEIVGDLAEAGVVPGAADLDETKPDTIYESEFHKWVDEQPYLLRARMATGSVGFSDGQKIWDASRAQQGKL